MQAYFALYWWFLTWIVNSRQFTSNAFFFIIFFAQNAYLSILLGFWFFFFNVAHWFLYARVWNKMFWRDKKKFHNPVILFLRFVFLFWAVPFSFFLEFQLFFSFLTFFSGRVFFFGLFLLLLFGVGERWFFLSYISRFFKIFRFFCTFFWFCIDIFFVKPLLKNKSGKKKQNFCKYLFSSNYDLVLISFFVFSSFF